MEQAASDPADREVQLRAILPAEARHHHRLLREIFAAEIEYRRSDGSQEYFENIYHCALLLYEVADPADVPMMWAAKYDVNFDLQCGFDLQFMLGAGVPATVQYLKEHGHEDIAHELEDYSETEWPLSDWESFRINYFYRS